MSGFDVCVVRTNALDGNQCNSTYIFICFTVFIVSKNEYCANRISGFMMLTYNNVHGETVINRVIWESESTTFESQ